MRLFLALLLILVAGTAHAATLHFSLPTHLPRPTRLVAGQAVSPTLHTDLRAEPATHTVVIEHRRLSRARVRSPTGHAHSRTAGDIDRQTVAPAVIHVHDGDTFYVGPDAFRLRGIDTPELGQPRAEAARDRLSALLHSGPVTIVRRAEDVYGRIVADVFVGGRSVARVLKAEGYAKPRVAPASRSRRSPYRSLDIPTPRRAS